MLCFFHGIPLVEVASFRTNIVYVKKESLHFDWMNSCRWFPMKDFSDEEAQALEENYFTHLTLISKHRHKHKQYERLVSRFGLAVRR